MNLHKKAFIKSKRIHTKLFILIILKRWDERLALPFSALLAFS